MDLYRRAAAKFGTTVHPVGLGSPGFVADTDEAALETAWPYYKQAIERNGGRGLPLTRRDVAREITHGSLYMGSPETVAQKMARAIRTLGVGRVDMLYTLGSMPAADRLRSVELYGAEVIPRVRELLSAEGAPLRRSA
jgi:alkanesulfonate monooxygenase SsuD/methylene tetrahydromethanopterin reductase-like flavin-dependent oxidoreductase (luciferase family)